MSQSTVYAIVQDSTGYIWFGTADGIDIYDGHGFRHLRHNPDVPGSLSGNYVRALLVGRDGRVWVGTLGGGLNRYTPATRTFRAYRKGNGPHDLISDDIHCLYESRDGFLWIGSESGVSRYNPRDDSFIHYAHQPEKPSSLAKGVIRAIAQTRDGTMWFGSADHGLSSLAPSSASFIHYRHQDNDANSLGDDTVNAIHQDRKGVLWVATEYGGLNKLDLDSGTFSHYQKQDGQKDGLNDTEVTAILEDSQGMLWLGTWSGGLNHFDPFQKKFKSYRTSPANPNSLSSDTIISLFADRSGVLWAGTFDSGVNSIAYQGADFAHYGFDPLQQTGLIHKMTWSFAEDQTGHLWVGTKKGLSRFDPETDTFVSYLAKGECAGIADSVDIRAIAADGNYLWLGTKGGGLLHFNPSTCAIHSYKHDAYDPASLSDNQVRLLLKDQQHRLWIGTSDGLNALSPEGNAIKRYPTDPRDGSALPHQRIRALYQAGDGTIWIGTSGGLSRYNRTTDSFETITAEKGLLSDNDVRSLYQDSDGFLWIATGGGLTRHDPRQGTSRFFYEKDGLANDTLYGLVPDGDHLWITTNIGMSRFDRRNFSCKNFTISDGLQSNEFNFNAYLKTGNGTIYVGGVNGFNRFTPRNLGANITPPGLHLEIALADKDNRQQRLPVTADAKPLQLQAPVYRLTFTATVLHYLNPQKNTYQYRLQGFDKDWMSGRAADNQITYSGLPPGDYLFQIRAFSSNGVPGARVVTQVLNVNPPVWETTWAYLLYALGLFAILFVSARLGTVALRQRARQLEESVKEKTLELHRKNEILETQSRKLEKLLHNQDDFYLRTVHELRTPLTLIRIPAERLSLHDQAFNKEHSLDIILRATTRLQRLTDQMFQAAIQGQTHEAGVQTIDLTTVLGPLFGVYTDMAARKSVTCAIPSLPAAAITINRQALEDIVHNLLDNALRYTPEGGRISAEVTLGGDAEKYLQLCVQDTGIGIEIGSQARIFECLYRSEQARRCQPQGKGVGLHIVRRHVDACGGSLEFESEPGQGSAFRIRLPCGWTFNRKQCCHNPNPAAAAFGQQDPPLRPNDGPSLLIIEDDSDLRYILQTLLADSYQLTCTGSAAQGLLQAENLLPDLVLCDVMLPDGSGFDIVRSLKNNEATSHIPLIVLTARGDLAGQERGWKHGADDYVVKPFSPDDLLLRIAGLLANRKRLQAWYQRRFFIGEDKSPNGDAKQDAELEYIAKLETQALLLIGNGNCCLENLAAAMGQSGRTLQRRLKSILDYSYTEYIQSVQLKKARRLLLDGRSVKEAAHEAGFNDPTYFSKVFKSRYNIPPGRYQKETTASSTARR